MRRLRTVHLICAVIVASACARVLAAAPTLLDVTQRVLEAELDAAKDAEQQADIRRALALLEQTRKAQAAAEDASRRAEEAAQDARDAAALAEAHRHAAEARARAAGAQQALAMAVRAAVRQRAQVSEPADAGVD
jgi:hypothetical protein